MDNNIVDKRTKGEWETTGYSTPDYVKRVFTETEGNDYLIRIRKKNGKLIGACYGYLSHKEEAEANAAFICKAVNNYDSLLEENSELKTFRDAAIKEVNYWKNKFETLEETHLDLVKAMKEGKLYFDYMDKIIAKAAIQKAEQ